LPLILESWVSGNTTLRQEIGGKTAITYFTIKDNRLGTIPYKAEYGQVEILFLL
jgi:hypothetical protein